MEPMQQSPRGQTPQYQWRIALVDNDERALDSLRTLIVELVPEAFVANAYTNGREAVDYCTSSSTKLNLLVLDMSLEGLQGSSVCRRIRQRNKYLPILCVTSFSLNRYLAPAKQAGAQGLVTKSDESKLGQAIRQVMQGHSLEGFEEPYTAYVRLKNEYSGINQLTAREEEIISLCADEGLTDREISQHTGIAESTVRKHMQHINEKLGVSTSRQAVSRWLNRSDTLQ